MARTKDGARKDAKKGTPKKERKAKKGKDETPKKPRRSDQDTGGIRKPHRFRSGTRALMNIRKYQGRGKYATMTLLPKEVVYRVVREFLADAGLRSDYKLKRRAFNELHQAFEWEGLKQLECANMIAVHAGHQGIAAVDLHVAGLVRANHRADPIVLPGWRVKGKQARERALTGKRTEPLASRVFQAGRPVKTTPKKVARPVKKVAKQPRPAKALPKLETGHEDDEETTSGAEAEECPLVSTPV